MSRRREGRLMRDYVFLAGYLILVVAVLLGIIERHS